MQYLVLLEISQNRFLHASVHDALQVVISFCWKKLISVTWMFELVLTSAVSLMNFSDLYDIIV